jgi:small-conductance mechanosensitive channel
VEKVSAILKQVALEHPNVLKSAEYQPVVRFSDFGDSSLMFKVFIYIDDVANRHKVTSEYRKAIYERFAAEGIGIPFPQRVVHFVDETKKSERN